MASRQFRVLEEDIALVNELYGLSDDMPFPYRLNVVLHRLLNASRNRRLEDLRMIVREELERVKRGA